MAQTTIQGSFLGDATVTGAKIGADFISAQTVLSSGLATADELIVSDAGVIKKMAMSVWAATTITFTNKSIDLGTNTLTGSVAEFNTALQSESFATLGGTETLVAKTLSTPTINAGTLNLMTVLTVANDIDVGAYEVRALKFESDQATGTAPLTVASTTVVTNLNADLLDGVQGASYSQIAASETLLQKTLTSPVLNTGVSGSAILDSDAMSGVSATKLSSSESIKAYVDAAATTYTDALIDGTVNNLLVLRNVHNEISTISSTTVIDGGPWEFYDGDSATLSKATTLLGGYIITLPATANQRGHFRFPTGFGSYGSSNSVTSAQDWTISCRVILAGNDRFDFFMGMMLHTDTTDYTYNAARRSFKHRIGIATDFILDNFHLFVDDDGSETVEETSTSPNGGAVHRITLKIRNGGQLVQGFLDGVQIGNDITANIPTITAGILVCGTMSDAAGTMAVQTCEIQDLVAFREA